MEDYWSHFDNFQETDAYIRAVNEAADAEDPESEPLRLAHNYESDLTLSEFLEQMIGEGTQVPDTLREILDANQSEDEDEGRRLAAADFS